MSSSGDFSYLASTSKRPSVVPNYAYPGSRATPQAAFTPLSDDPRINQLCLTLRGRLSRIIGFNSHFALPLLAARTPNTDLNDLIVTETRELFSLGIPLCYIFDLLPADEGFGRINMSQFSAEEYAANPDKEKRRAINLFITHVSSEKVRRNIPGCVPFSITDVWDTDIWDASSIDGLIKVCLFSPRFTHLK
jgi:cell division control protein 24